MTISTPRVQLAIFQHLIRFPTLSSHVDFETATFSWVIAKFALHLVWKNEYHAFGSESDGLLEFPEAVPNHAPRCALQNLRDSVGTCI